MKPIIQQRLHSHTVLYTDGGCFPNPGGNGGWGVVMVRDGQTFELYGGEPNSTNNRMEITAAIQGLKNAPRDKPVLVVTDSQYVKNGITQWVHGWRRRNWRNAEGNPVKNRDLWEELIEVQGWHSDVEWVWTRGHADDQHNERADALATLGKDVAAA